MVRSCMEYLETRMGTPHRPLGKHLGGWPLHVFPVKDWMVIPDTRNPMSLVRCGPYSLMPTFLAWATHFFFFLVCRHRLHWEERRVARYRNKFELYHRLQYAHFHGRLAVGPTRPATWGLGHSCPPHAPRSTTLLIILNLSCITVNSTFRLIRNINALPEIACNLEEDCTFHVVKLTRSWCTTSHFRRLPVFSWTRPQMQIDEAKRRQSEQYGEACPISKKKT